MLLVLATVMAGGLYLAVSRGPGDNPAADTGAPAPEAFIHEDAALPDRAVLDISVHTLDELRVLLDRAEQLSSRLGASPGASVVLVLHGPEVEFFSSRNYARYRDVVDQAARLDAFEIVDVKICQTMMTISGVERDDIPAFIEQVPDGAAELERLRDDGFVYF
jgi:intracellular sulfur oxidation DsrE/DsrF family protein